MVASLAWTPFQPVPQLVAPVFACHVVPVHGRNAHAASRRACRAARKWVETRLVKLVQRIARRPGEPAEDRRKTDPIRGKPVFHDQELSKIRWISLCVIPHIMTCGASDTVRVQALCGIPHIRAFSASDKVRVRALCGIPHIRAGRCAACWEVVTATCTMALRQFSLFDLRRHFLGRLMDESAARRNQLALSWKIKKYYHN